MQNLISLTNVLCPQTILRKSYETVKLILVRKIRPCVIIDTTKAKGAVNMAKKNKKHIVIAAAVAIIMTVLLIYRYYIPDMKTKKQFTPAAVEYTYDDSVTSSELAEYQSQQGWQLTLVNNDTPICENCSVILTALDNGQAVDCRIYPQLQKMFDDARSQGIYPTITSSFRTSKDQQEILESKYEHYQKIGYSDKKAKAYAEEWVAMPGTSEHELGLCVDIASGDNSVTNDDVWNWLSKNSYKYGFIQRYTAEKQDITGIIPEEWHFRYVGKKAAEEMHEKDLCLEEYLQTAS